MDIANLMSQWWVWMALALALGILEVLAPGFIFLGFALSAFLMALLHAVLPLALSVSAKIALFAGLSLLGWYVMRRFFQGAKGSVRFIDDDVNDG